MTSDCQLATYRSGDVLFCQSLPQQWHRCTPVGTDETNMPTKEQEARGKRADLEQIQDRFEWIFATQRLRWVVGGAKRGREKQVDPLPMRKRDRAKTSRETDLLCVDSVHKWAENFFCSDCRKYLKLSSLRLCASSPDKRKIFFQILILRFVRIKVTNKLSSFPFK